LKAKTKGVYITPWSDKENILVVGPISGDKYQDIIFPFFLLIQQKIKMFSL
jgi:apocytochrome f